MEIVHMWDYNYSMCSVVMFWSTMPCLAEQPSKPLPVRREARLQASSGARLASETREGSQV